GHRRHGKSAVPYHQALRVADRPGTRNRAGRDAAARLTEATCESVSPLGVGGMCEREIRERQDAHQRREKWKWRPRLRTYQRHTSTETHPWRGLGLRALPILTYSKQSATICIVLAQRHASVCSS